MRGQRYRRALVLAVVRVGRHAPESWKRAL